MTATGEPLAGFELTDEERLLEETVRAFAEREIAPRIGPFVERQEFPTELVRQMASLGLLGIPFDPAYDGGGAGMRGLVVALEALARVEPGVAAIVMCHAAPMTVLAEFGSEAQKRRWLAPMCRGEIIGSFGITEEHGGSNVAGVRTRATPTPEGEGLVLRGGKVFSTNAGTPLHGLSVVLAVTHPDRPERAHSCFVVPVGTPGFSVGGLVPKIGWRLADSRELIFDDCRLPADHMVGVRGEGLKQMLVTVSYGRIAVAACAVGLAQRALDLALAYGKSRRPFGQPILEHQGVAFPLADLATQLHAARLMTRHAASLADAGRPFRLEASMAKLFASEVAMAAAHRAIQVHGAYGVTHEYPVSWLLGEAKVLEIVEGTSEIQRLLIARLIAE